MTITALRIDPIVGTISTVLLDTMPKNMEIRELDYGNRVLVDRRSGAGTWRWGSAGRKLRGEALIIGFCNGEPCDTLITVAEARETVKFVN